MAGGELGSPELTFLWDPSFTTWSAFGVRTNSSMALLSADLGAASSVFFGFGRDEQEAILEALPEFS